jgi:YgiT-type zinc finger domain-containing protein
MVERLATIPFVLRGDSVVVVKNTPAEVCEDCSERIVSGEVVDAILPMLRDAIEKKQELTVVEYAGAAVTA